MKISPHILVLVPLFFQDVLILLAVHVPQLFRYLDNRDIIVEYS